MDTRKAFTLVELLTTLVIIALLVGILLPSIAAVRGIARQTAQKAQFASIDIALEAFKQDYGDYPPSSLYEPVDPPGREYGGTQKLTEALLGWDLMGFDPNTAWRRDGYTGTTIPGGAGSYDPDRVRGTATLFERRGPYLEVAKTNVFHLGISASDANGLYVNTALLEPMNFVICDVFGVKKITDAAGKTVTAGSPILYYKANTTSKSISAPSLVEGRIYNYKDNWVLVNLGKLTTTGAGGQPHPLGYSDGTDFPVFYNYKYDLLPVATYGTNTGYGIKDPKVTQNPWPYRPDSYILISAGNDGLYGTADDIHNY